MESKEEVEVRKINFFIFSQILIPAKIQFQAVSETEKLIFQTSISYPDSRSQLCVPKCFHNLDLCNWLLFSTILFTVLFIVESQNLFLWAKELTHLFFCLFLASPTFPMHYTSYSQLGKAKQFNFFLLKSSSKIDISEESPL